MTYDIYRNTTSIATVNPTGTQTRQIMGANTVAMAFTLPTQTLFKVGDFCDVYGERYYVNFAPSEKEQSSIRWEYNLELQAIPYDLIRAKYFGYNANNVLNVPDHDLTGDATAFLTLLLANLNRIQSGWTIGDVDSTQVLTLQFSANDNCLAVLSRLAEQFKTEYWIEGKVIHLTKRGEILATTLEYGQGKGLRSIERVPLDQNPPITRLYVYGSAKNLPASYRGYQNRLQLPVSVTNGYLEANVAEYGIREDIYINEEIYPNREGVVSASANPNQFSDSAIDFDINAQLMPGITAKVKFISGSLSGYQFEVSSYNHATRTIKFNNNTDEKAFTVPSETQRPAVGDKWVIFDIIMPDSYVTEAENKLLTDGQTYHSQNSGSRYNYNLATDPFHFERQSLYLQLGKYITLISPEWGINGSIRIVGFTRDIQHPYQYPSVEVSEVVQINPAVIADSKQRELDRAIANNKLTDIQRARNNWRTTAELATILDTLKAEMLLIMVEGGQYSSDIASSIARDSFSTTAGTIQHEEYIENGGIWNVIASSHILTGGAKHVYIKADKASIGATVVLSDTKIGVEDVAGYYHFPFGIISSIINNTRIFSTTKGYVRINGNNIQAGAIVSTDGLTGFDLDNSTIFGNIKFRSSAGGLKDVKDVETAVTDLEGTTESLNNYITNTLPVDLAALQSQIDGSLESYFYGYDPTLINIPSSDWTTDEIKDTHLGDLFYNNISGESFRFQKNGTAYEWLLLSDTGVSEALAKANLALDTADGKRRVFVNQPITPYDIGDLWAQGSTGELMRCVVSRLTGSYIAADWGRASKYTDDTAVNNLVIGGRNYYKTTTPIDAYDGSSALKVLENNGFVLTGAAGGISTVRMSGIFDNTYSGFYVVSFKASSSINGANFKLERDDALIAEITLTTTLTAYSFVFDRNPGINNFIDFQDLLGFTYNFVDFKVEKGNKSTDWTPAPEDVSQDATNKANTAQSAAIASANAFAESVAISKANTAQAAAIASASSDAQTKADNAYNTAVSASNAYAATAANNASSEAQIAAAADASNKATTAYNDAVAAANTAYTSLTNSLKSLAYQDVVQLAELGETVIENGKIKTDLLDAAYIRANIIDTAYITGLDLNFVKGTIGGFAISSTAIIGDSGQVNLNSNSGILEITSGVSPSVILKNRFVNGQGQSFVTRGVKLDGFGAEIQNLLTTGGSVRFNNIENAHVPGLLKDLQLRWFYGSDGLNYLSFAEI